MSVPFPPPQFAPLTPILIAVTIQAPALLLLFGFESELFLRLPKLLRFVAHVNFVVLSFLFILALLFEFMYGRIALPARVALYAWMIFGIAAMSWSFFRGWISKDSVTGWTIIVTTIGCIFLALTSHGGAYMEVARRTQCRNNLKQIGIALIDYADKKGRFPQAVEREKGGPATSWRVTFLSAAYMPQPIPYDRSQSWERRPTAQRRSARFHCIPAHRTGFRTMKKTGGLPLTCWSPVPAQLSPARNPLPFKRFQTEHRAPCWASRRPVFRSSGPSPGTPTSRAIRSASICPVIESDARPDCFPRTIRAALGDDG